MFWAFFCFLGMGVLGKRHMSLGNFVVFLFLSWYFSIYINIY